MIEIILLFLLTRLVGRVARRKGQKPSRWQWRIVLLWLALDILGFTLGYAINRNVVLASMMGMAMGVGSYLFVRSQLDKLPDAGSNWQDRMGRGARE